MSKLPSGFLFFFFLLLLVLFSSPGMWGGEIVISETMWNGFKLEYAQLVIHNESLSDSLDNSASIISELKTSSEERLIELNWTLSELTISNAKLKTAETQAVYLGSLLEESESSLAKLTASIKKDRARNILIGGGIGLILGAIVTGLIIGLVNG